MQKAFPKIDVMAEFWKMQGKTSQKPSMRPFLTNITGFVQQWLQNATDDYVKTNENGKEYIKGTDIEMSFRAKGLDPSHFDDDSKFDDFFDPICRKNNKGVAK